MIGNDIIRSGRCSIDLYDDGSIGIEANGQYASVDGNYDEFVDQLLAAIARRKRRDGRAQHWPTQEPNRDRSSLDAVEGTRYVVVKGTSLYDSYPGDVGIDDIIEDNKRCTTDAFTVYESVAHVAAQPRVERAVTRIQGVAA